MSVLRRVPPAHSPVPPAALAAGLQALLRPDPGLHDRMASRVARRFGARRVLFTDSGTTALRLALEGAASVRGGTARRVALPAFGCYDLLTAVAGAEAQAALYDVDPRTLSPEPESLRRILREEAGVLVAAHLYGVPVELGAVEAVARSARALVIEDAAQGVGASYWGRPLGAFGSVAVLSFGRGKGLSGGGGGALLAHDDEGEAVLTAAVEKVTADRPPGVKPLLVAAAQSAFSRPSVFVLPASLPFLRLGDTVYQAPSPSEPITRASLAVVERSWGPSLREAKHRRRRGERLLARVREATGLSRVEVPEGGTPGYLRLPVVAHGDGARERLASGYARRLGVMPGYPKPIHRLDAFAAHRPPGGCAQELPGSEFLARRLFTLPVHGRMSPDDLARVERLILADGA